jgi:hypothetical protein
MSTRRMQAGQRVVQPWAVAVAPEGGPAARTQHRSQPDAQPIVHVWRGTYLSSIDRSSCSVQSLPLSAKLDSKRCESVRRKRMFSRSLVAQYTHRSPRLSFLCPPQTVFAQGTSSRISQATHFLCTRASSRTPSRARRCAARSVDTCPARQETAAYYGAFV